MYSLLRANVLRGRDTQELIDALGGWDTQESTHLQEDDQRPTCLELEDQGI